MKTTDILDMSHKIGNDYWKKEGNKRLNSMTTPMTSLNRDGLLNKKI